MRESVFAARARRSDDERRMAGEALGRHAAVAWPAAGCVAAFVAFGSEPPTETLIRALRDRGVVVLLPVVDGDALDWAALDDTTQFEVGPLGLGQPTGPRLGPSALRRADVVVVPALAVDRHGNRLGRGRGYYDRALRDVTAPVVAVGYDDELVDQVPTEPHDRPVDGFLSPAGLVRCTP